MLNNILGFLGLNDRTTESTEIQTRPTQSKRSIGPTAYINCGRGIEFVADFVVGMTLRELVEFLQVNCSYQTMYGSKQQIPWLPSELRLCSVNDLSADHDYVIQPGDYINLDLQKKLPGSTDALLAD